MGSFAETDGAARADNSRSAVAVVCISIVTSRHTKRAFSCDSWMGKYPQQPVKAAFTFR